VPAFESIIGQKQPKRMLSTLLRNGIIPHALLFSGIDGVGKRAAAMTFAMACNCFNRPTELPQGGWKSSLSIGNQIADVNPCGHCASCRKILSGNHPDIISISPSGPFIRIAQIRALCDILSMKPYEAKFRVVIISDAQTMNPEAGNALLKVLEEPPGRTILILTAIQTSDLLPTVLSRCQHIRFNPIPRKDLETLLIEKEGFYPNEAKIMAVLANGSFSKALFLKRPLKQTDWVHWRNWLLSASGLYQPETLSSKPVSFLLAFAEQLTLNKEILVDALAVLKSWLRDLVICKFCPEKIINKDLTDKIQYVSQKVTVASLLSKIDAIQTAQKSIQANANLRLTLDTMIIKLTC
jgi:DNA polymerase-3 subunit delta'